MARCPPKDQIKEIRINTNPFTTEYSRSGFGRIEIITKPGTGKLRGNFNFNFRSDALNATQFAAPTKLPYNRQNYQGNVSGPFIHNKLTMTINAQRQDSFNTATIKSPGRSHGQDRKLRGIRDPAESAREFQRPRPICDFSEQHLELHHRSSDEQPQQLGRWKHDSAVESIKFRIQRIMDSSSERLRYFPSRFVHDTRLEFTSNHTTTNPSTLAQSINVTDAFNIGGSSNVTETTNRSLLFGDTLFFNSKGFTLKAGTQGDYYRDRLFSQSNFLGTYTFSSIDNYLAGTPTLYTQNTGNPLIQVNQFEFGAFVQTDIAVSKRLLVSPGVRYQVQSASLGLQQL